jgi:hypothetical protein
MANALILLAIKHHPEVVPLALRLATEHRNASSLRYSAIVALIYADDQCIINDLIAFADPADPYYINVIDVIGSLCMPSDFPRVLPLLRNTKAGLSSAFYHFRELTTKEALTAGIEYVVGDPGVLNGNDLDSYLEPLFDLIPQHWANDTAAELGLLLAALERGQYTADHQTLVRKIISHLAAHDHNGLAVRTMITALAADETRIRLTGYLIAPLITPAVAHWINLKAPGYASDVVAWLPLGPARDVLAPHTPAITQAQQDAHDRYIRAEQQRELAISTTRTEHQNTIRVANDMNAILGACERLPKEHWPELSAAQCEWLTQHVTTTLVGLDLARSVRWQTENTWTQPRSLPQLLHLIDIQPTTDQRHTHRACAPIVAGHRH